MTKSRERTILGVVLGGAVLALGVDRVLLGGASADATADTAAIAVPSPPAAAVASVSGRSAATSFDSGDAALHGHFADLAVRHAIDFEDVADAFVPGPVWGMDEPETTVAAVPARTALAFRNAHVLRGVLISPGGPTAIVDQSALRVGEAMDGAELIAVHARAVVFERDGVLITLALEASDDP